MGPTNDEGRRFRQERDWLWLRHGFTGRSRRPNRAHPAKRGERPVATLDGSAGVSPASCPAVTGESALLCTTIAQSLRSLCRFLLRVQPPLSPSSILYFPSSVAALPPSVLCVSPAVHYWLSSIVYCLFWLPRLLGSPPH